MDPQDQRTNAVEQETQISPFLTLPGELRNMIYSYVLETEQQIIMMPYKKGDRLHQDMYVENPTSNSPVQLNQMQYVCKQLQKETSTLPPTHCQDLLFSLRTDTKECASSICATYLANATPETLASIRYIDVHERILYRANAYWKRIFDPLGISRLVTFAACHPNICILVHLDSADPWKTHDSIVDTAELCDMMANKHVTALGDASEAMENLAHVWPGYALDARPFPGNIMFRPGCGVDGRVWGEWMSEVFSYRERSSRAFVRCERWLHGFNR